MAKSEEFSWTSDGTDEKSDYVIATVTITAKVRPGTAAELETKLFDAAEKCPGVIEAWVS